MTGLQAQAAYLQHRSDARATCINTSSSHVDSDVER
jgi:hypothetical protein